MPDHLSGGLVHETSRNTAKCPRSPGRSVEVCVHCLHRWMVRAATSLTETQSSPDCCKVGGRGCGRGVSEMKHYVNLHSILCPDSLGGNAKTCMVATIVSGVHTRFRTTRTYSYPPPPSLPSLPSLPFSPLPPLLSPPSPSLPSLPFSPLPPLLSPPSPSLPSLPFPPGPS